MPNTKISGLSVLLGAALAATDLFPIVDVSASLTKSITVQEFLTGILGSTGINGATVTTSNPLLNMTQTWNAGGVTFTGWKLDVTDTASAAGSLLMALQVDGVTKLSMGKAGPLLIKLAAGQSLNAFEIRTSTDVLVSRFTNDGTNFQGSGSLTIVDTGFTNGLARLINVGDTGYLQLGSLSTIGWNSANSVGGTIDLILARDAANVLAQRNGIADQSFRLYGSYTDSGNNVRLESFATATYAEFRLRGVGTGAPSSLGIYGATSLSFGGSYVDQWQITSAGQLSSLIADIGIKCNAYKLGTTAFNHQTGTGYTLLATDDGKIVTLNNGAGITLTVPASLGAQFNCTIMQLGAGQVTVVAGGTMVNSYAGFLKLAGQYAAANLNATAADVLVLSGNLAA